MRLHVIGLWEGLRGITGGMVEESGRRTSRTDSIAILALLRHLSLLTRIWWRQSRSVWLVVRTLRAGIGSLALLRVHGLLLVALRRWRILARLLLLTLLGSVLAVAAVGRQWLTVCSVQLSVRRWVLAAPHRVRRHEGLSLRTHWREDTFLREAHAIGASTILGLLEARTSDLGDALAAKLRKTRRASIFVPSDDDSIDTQWPYADVVQAELVGSPFAAAAHTAVDTWSAVAAERDTGQDAWAAASPWLAGLVVEQ